MKNSSQFLALLVLATACAPKKPQTLISRFESKHQEFKSVERALASAPQGQCLRDIFNTETLKAEIRQLEKKYAGAPKVQGNWRHIELSALPVPQANFLKTYGDQLGDLRNPESIDFSPCQDVVCLYNRVYGKDDSVAGYVHYGWYLKFGNMLAADNKVPAQVSPTAGEYNGKVLAFENYLFNDKELYALWRLSLMLTTPHTSLRYLKEVQRIPRGEPFEGVDLKNACGLAYSQGFITLTDGCLSVNHNPDQGYLYQATIHELSHHIDFEQGRGSKNFYRSHRQDYLDLSGMFLTEYVDETGKTQRKWNLKPGAKLITNYAGAAPQENFAESLAVFRTDGDSARRNVTPEHFDFISNGYYQSRSFEREELLKAWVEKSVSDIGKAVFKAVLDCGKDPVAAKSAFFKPQDFSTPVLPGTLNCFGERADEIVRNLRAKFLMYEPEGCQVMNDIGAKTSWEPLIRETLKSHFDRYLQELQKDKDYLERIQRYYAQVSDKKIARDSYLACFEESDEAECYATTIRKSAYDRALELLLPEAQTREMMEMYASYHPFDLIKEETRAFYRTFVLGREEAIRAEARELWSRCEAIPQSDEASPSGTLFQPGSGYMISSLFNCLNAEIPDSVKKIVRNFSFDGMKVQSAREELILSREVQPILIQLLKDWYSEKRGKELIAAQNLLQKEGPRLRSQLRSNFGWVKNVIDSELISSDCKREAVRLIPFVPLFWTRMELFAVFVEKNICDNIARSPEFQLWLESSKAEFSQRITTGLEEKLLKSARSRADECLREYPVDSALSKVRYRKQREACLLDEWPKLERAVLAEALNDPLVIRLQFSPDDLKTRLQSGARRAQLRVMKEKFN